MNKLLSFVGGAALCMGLCMPQASAEIPVAVGAKVGTPGIGGEITVGLNDNFNFRTGVNAFSYEYNGTESDVEYDFDLKLLSFPLLVDWHPFYGSGFRLTAGAYINSNELESTAVPTGTYDIGGVDYDAGDVGSLTGDVDFNSVAPFLGIGWGNAVGEDTRLSLALDLGVMFQGSPDVDLDANGARASDDDFLANLKKEEESLEDDIEIFKYYPVVMLGLTYKF